MIPETPHIVFEDLQKSFSTYADQTAIIDKDGKAYSYAEFEQCISGVYHFLKEKNIKQGDKVLIAVPMSLQLYAILEALFALGATAVFLDPWMTGKKMSSVIRQVQPELFIVTKKLSRITWLLSATWKLKKWKVQTIPTSSKTYELAPVKDNDNALITFTSGTSGEPKGANRTFGFLHAQAETLKPHLLVEGKTAIDYTNFPIVGLANFALGNTVAIPQLNLMKIHQANPNEVIEQLNKQKVERLIISPALLKKILNPTQIPTHLKRVVTGGAPISTRLVKTALHTFKAIHFEAIYGSTEAEPICTTTFQEIDQHLKTPLKGVYVGQPVEEIELRIICYQNKPLTTTDFENSQLPAAEVGEIVVSGKHVNKQYYENPTAFAKHKIVAQNGEVWHRTGDMGYLENNAVYLVGRDHRIMEKEGEPIYPYPIEQLIEMTFDLDDVGYVQTPTGRFILCYHSLLPIQIEALKKAILEVGYPIDDILYSKQPLARDARHKSKLQLNPKTGLPFKL